MLLGLELGILVLFEITKTMDPFYAYLIIGLMFVTVALLTIFMVKDVQGRGA